MSTQPWRIGTRAMVHEQGQPVDVPPEVKGEARAREILRVWRLPTSQVFSARVETWPDPAAWGLLLADLARHIARSYAELGTHSETAALERLVAGWHAEMESN